MAKALLLVNAEEAIALPRYPRWELIDGVVVELPPVGPTHGWVTVNLCALLRAHVRSRSLGRVYTEVGFIVRRNPDTVRAPDIAFVRKEQIPPEGEPRGFWEVVPDLVVEVISPSDTASEVKLWVREWIEVGTPMVWLVSPDTRTVQVVRSLTDRRELSGDDLLQGEELIPGFSCRVAELFED